VSFPSVTTSGATAFIGTLQGEKPAVITSVSGPALAKLAQTGTDAPGTDSALFSTLAEPVYNAQSETAFLANLSGPGVTKQNQSSVWWNTATGLSLVARTGDTVPTVAAAKWSSFVSLVLPDNAGPVFLAKLAAGSIDRGLPSDVKPTTNIGLFALDANRARRLLVRTGDSLAVQGTTKKLSLITIFGAVPGSPGQARNYNAAGDLAFRATFTDHSQAIMRLHLP